MAKALGWPLVELSPSHFIKKGLDFIESTSREIFNDLYNLHHAVVFFDECDELFRNRSESGETTSSRTILNFLTASMLPKLQDLHDKQNIIFVLGTNYYLDWCGAKGEDSEGLLELKNCDKSECHQEKIKEWNKMLKENKE